MIRDAVWLFVELLALFLGVSFGLKLLRRRLGDDRLRTLMGTSPVRAALRGIAIGSSPPSAPTRPYQYWYRSATPGCPPPGMWPSSSLLRFSTRFCSAPWP